MILYKTVNPKDILNLLASSISESLPKKVKGAMMLHLEFTENNSVEVFLISKENEKNEAEDLN